MARIRVTKEEIEEIKYNRSEIMMSIRTSRKFHDLVMKWRKKNKKPAKQLIMYATLKYLIEEGDKDANNI